MEWMMKERELPLITVTIPVYNQNLDYLEMCIRSVLQQTYRNLEIIIVDDGSEQAVADYLDCMPAKDNRIRIIHQENAGLSAARNAGLLAATGEYITFIDSDDFCQTNMVMRGYEEIKKSHADIAVWTCYRLIDSEMVSSDYKGASYCIYEKDDIWKYCCMCLNLNMFDNIYYPYCMCTWGKLYRTSLFYENPDILFRDYSLVGIGEDQDMVQRLFPKAKRLILFHEDLYVYRLSEDSITRRIQPHIVEAQSSLFDTLAQEIDLTNTDVKEAFDTYRVRYLVNVCTLYLWHPDCKMDYFRKRKYLKSTRNLAHFSEPLGHMKKKYFRMGHFFYLKCIQYNLYDIALLAAWYGARKKYEKKHICQKTNI